MATKIKLMRLGKMRAPYYRIVVADARTKRDGRVIETIGKYHPKENPSFIEVDADRAAYWLGVGAQPTEPVQKILSKTGDWQKFKGEAAPAPLLVAAPRADKKAAFEAAALESVAAAGATTPKKKAAPKKDAEVAAPEAASKSPVADAKAPAADARAPEGEAKAPAADAKAPEAEAKAPEAEAPAAVETPAPEAPTPEVPEAEAPSAEAPADETSAAEETPAAKTAAE